MYTHELLAREQRRQDLNHARQARLSRALAVRRKAVRLQAKWLRAASAARPVALASSR